MTPEVTPNIYRMGVNIRKVRMMAKLAGVACVLITGKGEPFMNWDDLFYFTTQFNDFPLEVQTNGLRLLNRFEENDVKFLTQFSDLKFNVVAFSFDCMNDFQKFEKLFDYLDKEGITVRVAMNVTSILNAQDTFQRMIEECKRTKVRQFSLRRIMCPQRMSGGWGTRGWIEKFAPQSLYYKYVEQMNEAGLDLVREMVHGGRVYDYEGISVMHIDTCMQSCNRTNDIRSLIFAEDGHMYTSWDTPASIIF